MRRAILLLTAVLTAATPLPGSATPPTHVVNASGPLAVLNGIAAVDLHALAPFPLGIPAPAGHVTLVMQSTFQPPGPRVIAIELWCTAVVGDASGMSFSGSGRSSDGRQWYVLLRPGPVLWEFGWSTDPRPGPCGAGTMSTVPLIGAAVITP